MKFILGGVGLLWLLFCGALAGFGGVVFGVAVLAIGYGLVSLIIKKA